MRKDILKLAIKKFKQLSKKYNQFINIIVDNWRGYRFVFDTEDVRKCKNRCSKCRLYLLLKNEKEGLFSVGLYPANKEDKKLFGPQNFLNCKTLKQYQDCYINFLLKKAKTKKEVDNELKLIKDFKIIFSKYDNRANLEKSLKSFIIKFFRLVFFGIVNLSCIKHLARLFKLKKTHKNHESFLGS